ncbi:MAG: malonyl CoA-acyl carrier protein transacylase [Flavobacteriales bacterium]|jgi:malonyl CoA-acyl carrier protein transacylase
MKCIMFPGQGSQFVGMGKECFDLYPEEVKIADEILGYSTKMLCLEDVHSQMNSTEYTQPLIYLVSALSYKKYIEYDNGVQPDYFCGHSLGEYCALYAAGAFSLSDGLRMVKKRGELMAESVGGGMAAILNIDAGKIEKYINEKNINNVSVANFNAPLQTVISGSVDEIELMKGPLEILGAIHIRLKTSGAFHSPYMSGAKSRFGDFLSDIDFRKINIPVISNVTAAETIQGDLIEGLLTQLTAPVRWTQSIRHLLDLGVSDFQELGPGRVLNKLFDQITKDYESNSQIHMNEVTQQYIDTVDWNKNISVGDEVKYIDDESMYSTRVMAHKGFNGRPVVYLNGCNGFSPIVKLKA